MNPAPRRPWLAALLAVVCTGLGHVYAGRIAVAFALQAVGLAIALALAAALRAGPLPVAVAALASVVFWVGQIVHAMRTARRGATVPRRPWALPLATAGLLGVAVAISGGVIPAARARVAHTIYVPSGAMIPTVQVGDYIAVAAGKPRVLRGAVVVHAAPAGSPIREPLLKRIVAVGGDTVEIRDGHLVVNDVPVPRERIPGHCSYVDRPEGGDWRVEPCVEFEETLDAHTFHTHCTPDLPCGDVEPQVVPAGMVWVAGDHRDHSADSRVYGPIPVHMIQGEVRWIIASWGPAGLRLDRFGAAIR